MDSEQLFSFLNKMNIHDVLNMHNFFQIFTLLKRFYPIENFLNILSDFSVT